MVSSGYRNPRRNDRIDGMSTSKHQWGKAVDLVPGRLPPGRTNSQAMELIEDAARDGAEEFRRSLLFASRCFRRDWPFFASLQLEGG